VGVHPQIHLAEPVPKREISALCQHPHWTGSTNTHTLHIPLKTCREMQSTGPKCHQIVWSPRLCPGPHLGAYSAPLTPSPRTSPHRPFRPWSSAIRASDFGPWGLAFTPPQYPHLLLLLLLLVSKHSCCQHPYLKISSYGPDCPACIYILLTFNIFASAQKIVWLPKCIDLFVSVHPFQIWQFNT